MSNDPRRALLRRFLAALAYRTQEALRGAPPQFADYDPGARVRRPRELLRHMTSVLGYARTFFLGGTYRAEPLDTLAAEQQRFHAMLQELAALLATGAPLRGITEGQLLQAAFPDAMPHAGQLALTRRFG